MLTEVQNKLTAKVKKKKTKKKRKRKTGLPQNTKQVGLCSFLYVQP